MNLTKWCVTWGRKWGFLMQSLAFNASIKVIKLGWIKLVGDDKMSWAFIPGIWVIVNRWLSLLLRQ